MGKLIVVELEIGGEYVKITGMIEEQKEDSIQIHDILNNIRYVFNKTSKSFICSRSLYQDELEMYTNLYARKKREDGEEGDGD